MLLRDLKAEIVCNDVTAWIENPRSLLPSGYDQEWKNPEAIKQKKEKQTSD